MHKVVHLAVAALNAGLLAVPGTASAADPVSGPDRPRPHRVPARHGPVPRPAAHRADGPLWLYYDAFFSGQVQEVQDPGTSACVNLPSEFEAWSQSSESSVSVQVYSQPDCAGTPDYTFAPNEYQTFLILTVSSARFVH